MRNYSRVERDLEIEARYLGPTFPTKSGYQGMRIVYNTSYVQTRNQLALFLPALFYPHFSPFLSLTRFPPFPNSTSFERLDNENRSRVSVLKRVLNERLRGK